MGRSRGRLSVKSVPSSQQKAPDLSLQRDVIIQPLERVEQGLTCVGDLTGAEKNPPKKTKSLNLQSETGNSTVSLLETRTW